MCSFISIISKNNCSGFNDFITPRCQLCQQAIKLRSNDLGIEIDLGLFLQINGGIAVYAVQGKVYHYSRNDDQWQNDGKDKFPAAEQMKFDTRFLISVTELEKQPILLLTLCAY